MSRYDLLQVTYLIQKTAVGHVWQIYKIWHAKRSSALKAQQISCTRTYKGTEVVLHAIGQRVRPYRDLNMTEKCWNHSQIKYIYILHRTQCSIWVLWCTIYIAQNAMMAGSLSGFFQRNFNTRNSVNLRSTYHKKKISQQSIRIAGPRIWNNFPILCKSSISLHSFKKLLKKYLQNLN